MEGFELQISGVRSNRTSTCAITAMIFDFIKKSRAFEFVSIDNSVFLALKPRYSHMARLELTFSLYNFLDSSLVTQI